MSTVVVAFLLVEPPFVAHVRVVVSTASIVVFPIPVVALVPTVRIRSEWCRRAPTLPPSTLLVELVDVSGMAVREAVFVPLIGFSTPVAEITPTANERLHWLPVLNTMQLLSQSFCRQ